MKKIEWEKHKKTAIESGFLQLHFANSEKTVPYWQWNSNPKNLNHSGFFSQFVCLVGWLVVENFNQTKMKWINK